MTPWVALLPRVTVAGANKLPMAGFRGFDAARLRSLALAGDGWHLSVRRFTLHIPGGVGASKPAERLPKLFAAPMTALNLRTDAALRIRIAARG